MSVAVAVYDYCCAPAVERWRDEFMQIRSSIVADFEFVRKERRITRRKPEKGVVRLVLLAGWLMLHLYAVIVFSIYHAFEINPLHAFYWFWSTTLSGFMYTALTYSDPGFIDKEVLLRLTSKLDLGVDVVGSDVGRGLLPRADPAGGAGTSVEMQSLPERPLPPAAEDGSASEDDEFGNSAPDGSALDRRARDALRTTSSTKEATDEAFEAWGRATQATDSSCPSGGHPTSSSSSSSAEAAVVAAVVATEVVVEVASEEPPPRPKGKGRAKIDPGVTSSTAASAPQPADGGHDGEDDDDDDDDPELAELRRKLAVNPRIVGYDEEGQEEAAREAARVAKARREAPKGIVDYFSGYCEEADMYLPLRAKYCKKHGRIVAKFDHYCYALGNSVGELNHGRFYRLVAMQVFSIWTGLSLSYRSEVWFSNSLVWTVANIPLLIVNILSWCVGVPLTILLCIHTFMLLTSSTTYEFIKIEKLEYLEGFYPFSFPFSQGLFGNIGHFCCPSAIRLWPRPPPESEWEDTFWRNKYYSCCG